MILDAKSQLTEKQLKWWGSQQNFFQGKCDVCGYFTEMCLSQSQAKAAMTIHEQEWHS